MRKTKTLAERLRDRLTNTHDDSLCWEYTGYVDKYGYGHFRFESKRWLTHRASWYENFGDIPKDMYVLHKCDNPPCCNPKHLFLGTALDNTKDMISKGRMNVGKRERHRSAKLTEAIVLQIRAEYATCNTSYGKLALKYNLSRSNIAAIITYRTWK